MIGIQTATTQRRLGFRATAALLCLTMPLAACGDIFAPIKQTIDTSIQDASTQLDITISQLQTTSASWQQLLKDLADKLTGEAKQLIGNDIRNLIDNSIAFAGTQVQCEVDFLRARIIETLTALKAKLLGETMPALEPRFCQAVPLAIDMALVPANLKVLNFYGFNFKAGDGYALKLEQINGTQQDVTPALNVPTTYAMTLTLGPSGVTLGNQARRLLLFWGDKLVSTVGIIQPQPQIPVCQTKIEPVGKQEIGPVPSVHIGGDKEFAGNGPRVTVESSIDHSPREVNVRLRFNARETRSDWTEVSGRRTFSVFSAPVGFEIERVQAGQPRLFRETATENWNPRKFELGQGGLLGSLQIIGDTGGDDTGRTQLRTAVVNPFQVVLRQVGNCQSPGAMNALIGTRFLSEAVKAKVGGSARAATVRLNEALRAVAINR